MRNFILGLIAGILLLAVAAYGYVILGYAPVATASGPLPLEKWFTHTALSAAIGKLAPKEAAFPPTEPNLVAGAKIYRQYCAECHGSPGRPKTAAAAGMFPPPPQLFHGKGVTDDPPGETYWKTANGIRLTGMPGFRGALSEEQMWQVSQLLATADKLPPSAREIVAQPPPAQ